MRAFQEQDFDKMAARVVEQFMSGQKLADMAAMEAQQHQLNPDQIERLVQAANTQAFLQLMEHQKAQGTPDMTGEFDPIDTRQIMQHLVGQVPDMGGGGHDMPGEPPGMQPGMPPGMGGHEGPPGMPPGMDGPPGMPPGGDAGPLPDEMQGHGPEGAEPPIDDDNDGPFPKGKKQKDKDDSAKGKDKDDDKSKKKEPPGPPQKDEPKEAAFRAMRRRKLADILEDQLRQAELVFDDEFQKLSSVLRRAHGAPTPDAFEKDALALHGNEVGIVVLGMVQADRGWPLVAVDRVHTKTAALVDHHIVDDTEANRIFENLVKIATEATRLKEGAEYARSLCS